MLHLPRQTLTRRQQEEMQGTCDGKKGIIYRTREDVDGKGASAQA